MNTTRRSEWLVPAGLVALSLVPAVFGTIRIAEVTGGAAVTPDNARFMAAPVPVLLHVLAAIPYSLVGAFQFAPAMRRRHRGWHRAAGRVLIVLGMVVALSGLWMTLTYPWPDNDGVLVYLFRLVFGTGMTLSIVLGVDAIRRRDFAAHGAWMMRAYAIGLGAGTQVLTHMPWFILVGEVTELSRGILLGAGWIINLAVAEWAIRRPRAQRRPVRPLARAA